MKLLRNLSLITIALLLTMGICFGQPTHSKYMIGANGGTMAYPLTEDGDSVRTNDIWEPQDERYQYRDEDAESHQLTLAAWIQPTQEAQDASFWYGTDVDENTRWNLLYGDEGPMFAFEHHGEDSKHTVTENNYPAGNWYYVVMVYNQGDPLAPIEHAPDSLTDPDNANYVGDDFGVWEDFFAAEEDSANTDWFDFGYSQIWINGKMIAMNSDGYTNSYPLAAHTAWDGSERVEEAMKLGDDFYGHVAEIAMWDTARSVYNNGYWNLDVKLGIESAQDEDNRVFYWTMDNHDKDQGIVYDEWGNHNAEIADGVITENPKYITGGVDPQPNHTQYFISGNGGTWAYPLTEDGENYLKTEDVWKPQDERYPYREEDAESHQLTLATWIKPTDGTQDGTFWHGSDVDENTRWNLQYGDELPYFAFENHGESSKHVSTFDDYPPDKWYYVVMVYNQGDPLAPKKHAPDSLVDTTASNYVGDEFEQWEDFFEAELDSANTDIFDFGYSQVWINGEEIVTNFTNYDGSDFKNRDVGYLLSYPLAAHTAWTGFKRYEEPMVLGKDFYGFIAEIAMWNTARSEYNNGSWSLDISAGIQHAQSTDNRVFYWTIDNHDKDKGIIYDEWGNHNAEIVDGVITKNPAVGIDEGNNILTETKLMANYPNPFNPVTNIEYKLRKAQSVKIEIYNLLGQRVRTLVDAKKQRAGSHIVKFDAGNLASGVYFYRMKTESKVKTRKMLLLK